MIGRDGISGLLVLGACVVLYALTYRIEGNPLVAIGPAFYPRLVFIVTGVLAVLMVASDVLGRRKRKAVAAKAAGPRPNYVLVVATFVVFVVYVMLMPYIGFRLSTFAFVLAMRVLLDWPANAKSWIGALALAAGTTLVTWYVFEQYLAVLLPRGRWTGF
jgi:hypothetical protein